MKQLNPYLRLLSEIRKFCHDLKFRETREMFNVPTKDGKTYSLEDVKQRTAAAEQLGYEVILEAKEAGLIIKYRKKLPEIPFNWRY